ncbi:MAG: GerMN domain-containing protein [Chloroflexota bacterium]
MKNSLTPLLMMTIATLACSVQLTNPTPVPSPMPDVMPPTQAVIVVTAAPASTLPPRPTLPPPTTASPAITATASGPRTVKIFLIAQDDNGKSGKKIGCNDSVVGVNVAIQPTVGVLRAAYESLLAQKSQFYGQSGLYNALYQSKLEVEGVNLKDDKAIVTLKGTLTLGGVCDNPRVEAQLTETGKQFDNVKEVEVLINGKPLKDVLSGK